MPLVYDWKEPSKDGSVFDNVHVVVYDSLTTSSRLVVYDSLTTSSRLVVNDSLTTSSTHETFFQSFFRNSEAFASYFFGWRSLRFKYTTTHHGVTRR